MTPSAPFPDEALRREILEEARRAGERLVIQAQEDAATLLAKATDEAETKRRAQLDAARKEAERRAGQIRATIPVEAGRRQASHLERQLQSLLDEILQRLLARKGYDYQEYLLSSSALAISRMAGTRFVVKLAPADHTAAGDTWVPEIIQRANRPSLHITLQADPSITSGGAVVEDEAGQQIWDNRLTSRLKRLWPELRHQIAAQGSGQHPALHDISPGGTTSVSSTGGIVTRVSGPVVTATGLSGAQMYEVVRVGELGLVGEIVRMSGGHATIQVYENTTLLKPGAPIQRTGAPLSVWLGPGLIGNIYDGIQRPLPALKARSGAWIQRGEKVDPLDTARRWTFTPTVQPGDTVSAGQVVGHVAETPLVHHCVMVPPGLAGTVASVVAIGDYTVQEPVAILDTPDGPRPISMLQQWPVRVPRPIRERLAITQPLITGQRIIDTFFPIGKGGCAAIPGGFGTGKTITQHQLAKWSDADIIVFIGCGERGNEMTEVLRDFPELKDPRSGRPLMERTILIANTSNMPVAAREVSIYTGITLAEYYRDMGLNVAVFADSTSRWAEALRELAARLEEMPAEEGFPATLPTRLAQFYERGGAVTTLSGGRGTISIVGAVSPPGGDFSEPVTQHTQRFIRCFWALDTELANARHYPSIHWLRSYSEYVGDIHDWWQKREPDWGALRTEALTLLQREERLQQIARLIGADALPDSQRLILFVAEILKDGFLSQSAFDDKDMYCTPERQVALLQIILTIYDRSRTLIQAGVPLSKIRELPCIPLVIHAKSEYGNSEMDALAKLAQRVREEMEGLSETVSKSRDTL